MHRSPGLTPRRSRSSSNDAPLKATRKPELDFEYSKSPVKARLQRVAPRAGSIIPFAVWLGGFVPIEPHSHEQAN